MSLLETTAWVDGMKLFPRQDIAGETNCYGFSFFRQPLMKRQKKVNKTTASTITPWRNSKHSYPQQIQNHAKARRPPASTTSVTESCEHMLRREQLEFASS